MSAGAKGFIVVLDKDFGEEGIRRFTEAVMMIRGVVDVQPIGDHNMNDYAVELRVKSEIRRKLYDFIKEAT